MFDKLSTIRIRQTKARQAWLAQRALSKGAVEVMGDRIAPRPALGAEIRIRDGAWEDHYDALGG